MSSAAVVVLIYSLVALTGGSATSPLHSFIYAWLVTTAALRSARTAVFTTMVAILSETMLAIFRPDTTTGPTFAAHLGLMPLFTWLASAILAREVRVVRKEGEVRLSTALETIERDARSLRLTGDLPPEPPSEHAAARDSEATMMVRRLGSVRAIQAALDDVLVATRAAVRAHSVSFHLLDADDGGLRIRATVGEDRDDEGVSSGTLGRAQRAPQNRVIPADEGLLSAVVRSRAVVKLAPTDGRADGLAGGCEGPQLRDRRAAAAAPVFGQNEGREDTVLGVLSATRDSSDPFDEEDAKVLEAMASEVSRAVEAERIFVRMDRAKYEHERLYEAFSLLNKALTSIVFGERLLDAVHRIKDTEFSAFTSFDPKADEHILVSVRSSPTEIAQRLVGQRFSNKIQSLLGLALKSRQTVPHQPLARRVGASTQAVLGDLPLPSFESVKVFPLSFSDEPLGTLVVGSFSPEHEVTHEEARMLETVVSHASVTLANARLFEQMEQMATTDGLTKLTNHRRFKELLKEALARAQRFRRKVSLVMVDADHFKRINDAHGHPVGDRVLVHIAEMLAAAARRTDVVARYGGEEFVLALDETDTTGAMAVAERIRQRIEGEELHGDFGRLSVTVSLGVATWPDHARTLDDLIECADRALYAAKRGGRNRVVASNEPGVDCPDPTQAAIRQKRAGHEDTSWVGA